jgi:hypothetical protein
MAMGTKRVMARVARVVATATRVVGNKEVIGKGGKGDGNDDKEGIGESTNTGNGDGDEGGGLQRG